jgi:hypothetical protein
VKRQRKGQAEKPHDSTDHELEAEQHGEKKVLAVWQAFDQIFGIRWSQAFGNDPLGQFKDAQGKQNPRMDQWIDALRPMPWPHLKHALKRIREAQKPYDGWLPDLPSFLGFAGRLPPPEQRRAPLEKISWISSICGLYLLRTSLNHGPFSDESMKRLEKVQLEVAARYNEMAKEEKAIEAFTDAEKLEWREVIEADMAKRFSKTPVEPMSEEEKARRLTLRTSSPTRENSSSSTPSGNSPRDVL